MPGTWGGHCDPPSGLSSPRPSRILGVPGNLYPSMILTGGAPGLISVGLATGAGQFRKLMW
jgi:hypothetical protein